jgi:hypothetical protein
VSKFAAYVVLIWGVEEPVNQKARGALTLLGFALIAAAAFHGARIWQSARVAPVRVEPAAVCDLRAGPCRQALAGGSVTFSISPGEIPLMKPLRLSVTTEGLAPEGLVVEIRGLNMAMGLNRTQLTPVGGGHWAGETILPVCSQRRMEWEAAVLLDLERRYELPFLFHTTRP